MFVELTMPQAALHVLATTMYSTVPMLVVLGWDLPLMELLVELAVH